MLLFKLFQITEFESHFAKINKPQISLSRKPSSTPTTCTEGLSQLIHPVTSEKEHALLNEMLQFMQLNHRFLKSRGTVLGETVLYYQLKTKLSQGQIEEFLKSKSDLKISTELGEISPYEAYQLATEVSPRKAALRWYLFLKKHGKPVMHRKKIEDYLPQELAILSSADRYKNDPRFKDFLQEIGNQLIIETYLGSYSPLEIFNLNELSPPEFTAFRWYSFYKMHRRSPSTQKSKLNLIEGENQIAESTLHHRQDPKFLEYLSSLKNQKVVNEYGEFSPSEIFILEQFSAAQYAAFRWIWFIRKFGKKPRSLKDDSFALLHEKSIFSAFKKYHTTNEFQDFLKNSNEILNYNGQKLNAWEIYLNRIKTGSGRDN